MKKEFEYFKKYIENNDLKLICKPDNEDNSAFIILEGKYVSIRQHANYCDVSLYIGDDDFLVIKTYWGK